MGNSVQIVRSVSLNNPNNINSLVNTTIPGGMVNKASASPTPLVNPSPSSVSSPQNLPSDSPLVVQLSQQGEVGHPGSHFLVANQKPQLATGQSDASFLLANQKPQIMNNINQSALNNQTNNHLKIRQQRKQSLK